MQKRRFNSYEDIQKALKEKWGNKYEIIRNNYQKDFRMHDKINIKCKNCGNISAREINSIFKFECKFCYGKNNIRHFRTNAELKLYVSQLTDDEYELISDHSKTRDIAIFKHKNKKCINPTKIFKMKIHNFITLNHRCPYCNNRKNKKNQSLGNQYIEKYLNINNINYIAEYKFDQCRSKRGRLLKFDFYLPDLNIVIEYDGEQHNHCVEYFGGEKTFTNQKNNDEIKNKFCSQNNIKLYRIKYIPRISLEKIFLKLDEILYNNVQRTSKV